MRRIYLATLLAVSVALFAGVSCSSKDDANIGSSPASSDSSATSDASQIEEILTEVAAHLPDHDLEAFETFFEEQEESGSEFALAAFAFLNRQLELAAWLYAKAVEDDGANAAALSNLGLCLHEMYMAADDSPSLLEQAIPLLKQAAEISPDNAAIQNNLGFALFALWQATSDASSLDAAEAALLKAISLNPTSAISLAHLAEVYLAKGDDATAAGYLNDAYRLDPINGVLTVVIGPLPPESAYHSQNRDFCAELSYHCENCPKSIIGQINFVTCMMAEDTARGNCGAGKPYAPDYDCSEEIPRFGIIIPGLQAGFSIRTPWGGCDVLFNGDGSIKYKVSLSGPSAGPVGTSLEATGTYNPNTGETQTDIGGKISVSMRGNDAADTLSSIGMSPAAAHDSVMWNVETGERTTEIGMDAFGGNVWHTH